MVRSDQDQEPEDLASLQLAQGILRRRKRMRNRLVCCVYTAAVVTAEAQLAITFPDQHHHRPLRMSCRLGDAFLFEVDKLGLNNCAKSEWHMT